LVDPAIYVLAWLLGESAWGMGEEEEEEEEE